MFMHCYRYVKDKANAEEVLMDGFLQVFTQLGKMEYRDEVSFRAWVKRIFINAALMFLRKRHKLIYLEEEYGHQVESPFTVEEELAAEEVYRLITQLPTGYRTVFNLYAIEGYSHQEIASLLQISESTSRAQLSKARVQLKTLFHQTKLNYGA
jgi:RNA polymerase sigma-70 factor (ECF subfamily)